MSGTPSPPLVVFDDDRGRFGPLTDRRPCFGIRTGAINNRVRIETTLGVMACALVVNERVAALRRARETDARTNELPPRDAPLTFHRRHGETWGPVTLPRIETVRFVNGRWPGVPGATAQAIEALPPGAALVQRNGDVVAAHLAWDDATTFMRSRCTDLPAGTNRQEVGERVLLERPWHILDGLEATLAYDLSQVPHRVAATAAVHPAAVLDDTQGPVVIADHATIGALAVLHGPCYIGPHTVVQPHSLIRPNTSLGSSCRVAGEISASILHDCTNKAHYGYLGNAIVGEWCNLGAGTTASNLKNTYGEVRMQLDAESPAEPTGRMFHGPIIGDFVRTAIGTLIPTGTCIGTASMIAAPGFAPKFTPAGAYVTDQGETRHDPDLLVKTVRAMMARRNLVFSAADEALLRDLVASPRRG